MKWDDVYAELRNKFRWAIATTAAERFPLTFKESLALASVLAGDTLTVMKRKADSPDFRIDQETASGIYSTGALRPGRKVKTALGEMTTGVDR